MKNSKGKSYMKKLAVVFITAMLLLSAGTAVFADEMPTQNGERGQNPPEKPSGENAETMPEKPDGQMNEDVPEKPEGEPGENVPEKPESEEPGQEMSEVPEKKDAAPELNEGEREDMTPPEDEDAEPGENVPEKPEENDAPVMEEQKEKAEIKDRPLSSVNLMAIEAYIENAGEDVDEAVSAAYEALSLALQEETAEGQDNDISDLEAALNEALESAGINLEDYEESVEMPQEIELSGEEETEEPAENESGSSFNPIEFIKYCWEKFLDLF